MFKQWKCALVVCLLGPLGWSQPADPQIMGDWEGTIANKLRVIARIERAEDKSLKGMLEVPDQGNAKIKIEAVSFDGKRAIRLELKTIGAIYEGEMNAGASEITGLWQQGGARVPLILRRAGVAAAATLQAVTRGRVPLQPCLAAGDTQALCGTYTVYENRETRAGRTIALNLMLLPADAQPAAPDPVFAFAGGPGGSAAEAYPLATYTGLLRKQRDIVLIDQRGTGHSNPLQCGFDKNDLQVLMNRSYDVESLSKCRAELEKRADLTQYTTSISADDVDEVREALGYDKIDLLGGSYGSQAALVYLRRHPAHVRSMVIEGVAPPDYRMPLPFAKTIQSAVQHLFADCAADSGCHQDFPNLQAEFETVVSRLDQAPAKFELPGPSGKPQEVTLSRGSFVSGLRPLLYQPGIVSQLPLILHRAYQNDWKPFASVVLAMHSAIADSVARGMAFSVSCAESFPFIGEADVRRETKGTYLGDFDVRSYQKSCRVWPHAVVSKDFLAPVRSNVPSLLIAGAEDPATPSWLAQHAAENLSQSRVVSIPYGTHLTDAACIDRIMVQFVNAGSPAGLDVECVNQIRNPPFARLAGR